MIQKNLERHSLISTIEETSVQACKEHWEFALENNLTLRDACYIKSFEKLSQYYDEVGEKGQMY